MQLQETIYDNRSHNVTAGAMMWLQEQDVAAGVMMWLQDKLLKSSFSGFYHNIIFFFDFTLFRSRFTWYSFC